MSSNNPVNLYAGIHYKNIYIVINLAFIAFALKLVAYHKHSKLQANTSELIPRTNAAENNQLNKH
jgi:hypothetical protein